MSTEIRNIVMDFNGFKALNGISLKIQDGEFIAVLGPSGCGKTTLLRLLAGFTPPSSGEIRIGEQVVANRDYVLPPNERFISMVFQSYALWPHMSVRKNVEFSIKKQQVCVPRDPLQLRQPRPGADRYGGSHRHGKAAACPVVRWPAAESGHCQSAGQ